MAEITKKAEENRIEEALQARAKADAAALKIKRTPRKPKESK